MKTIRWGIIGCGDVTEVKSGPGFAKASGSALVAVMRRTGALAKDYAERHHVPRWYDDGAALIADEDVDAVYVATPPSSHMPYVLQCAAAGKPVYVEKPMALNAGECQAMIDACRTAGVPLFTAYYRRALPRFLKVKALVDDGTIGDVRAVNIALYKEVEPVLNDQPWRVDPAISGGGIFVDMGCHTLDLLDYILGPIARVSGGAANQSGYYAAEDIVTASLEFASGVRGTGLWCFSGAGGVDRVEILGTRGSVSFASFENEPVVLQTMAGGREVFTIPHPAHVQQPLIQTIVDQLHGSTDSVGRGTCPSTGETAMRTTRIMDDLLRNYYPPA